MGHLTELKKGAQGYLFNPNFDKEIVDLVERCNDQCYQFNQIIPSDRIEQRTLLKKILGELGEDTVVNAPFWCDYGYLTHIGAHSFINRYCQIQDGGGVRIGSHVFIGPNCMITTAEHPLDVEQRNKGLEVALPVTIGDNVWIGASATILAGVTIGEGSVIGAGSVVAKDIPAGVVAVGVPCRVLRKITEADKDRYSECPNA